MTPIKKCCGTCGDDECRTGKILGMNGAYLMPYYCQENGFCRWKPVGYKDKKEGHDAART